MKWRKRAAHDGETEVVRTAEQIVSAAWLNELFEAAGDSEAAVEACARLHEQALGAVRAARLSGDPRRIAESQGTLQEAERDFADSAALRDAVSDLLVRELAERPCAVRVRAVDVRGE